MGEVVGRRGFLKGLGGAAGLASIGGSAAPEGPPRDPAPGEGASHRSLLLEVNGVAHRLEVEPRRTLADVLREDLGLTGTKVACDRAACGACTVLLAGRAVLACHTLALQATGKPVLTIEGLDAGGRLDPVQEAFIERDALQCGYCTPGMIMAIVAVLRRDPGATRDRIQEGLEGNICRCGAYEHILDAAVEAAAARRKAGR